MALRFGTDGVRGVANTALTPEFALSLGRAAARVLGVAEFVVGRDTRRSGPLLAQAFHAGLASEGASVVDLGVVPTPCVSYVAGQRAAAGAVVSASHNPFADNGIKIFGAGGRKLADDVESAIEAELAALAPPSRRGADVGDIALDDGSGVACYLDHLRSALAGRRLDGLQVVIDGANGAAAALAPGLFRSVGADVVAVCCSPSGININDGCGATHPLVVGRKVVATGARLGLALDGDADRLMAADHGGATVDGDQIMAVLARDLRDAGRLKHDTAAPCAHHRRRC